jgi:predicted AAA+ superfamily ATPase
MTDNAEVRLSASEYSDFFDEIQNVKNIGKEIKWYLENGVDRII